MDVDVSISTTGVSMGIPVHNPHPQMWMLGGAGLAS